MNFEVFLSQLTEFFFFDESESGGWDEDTHFEKDLGFDSLDRYELLLFMEINSGSRMLEDVCADLETLGQAHEWILLANRAAEAEVVEDEVS